MARIPYADTRPGSPGTPEFTMGQEQRRQGKADEDEIRMLNEQLDEMMRDPSLSSSDRQEVSELMDDIFRSEFGFQEASMGSVFKGAAQALGKQAKGAKAKILGGARITAQGIKDRAKSLTDRLRPKAEPGPKAKGDAGDFGASGFADDIAGARRAASASERASQSARGAAAKKGQVTRNRNVVEKGLRKGAPITVPGMVGLEIYDQLGGDEEPEAGEGRREDVIIGPDDPDYLHPEVSPERPGPSAVEDTRTPRQKRRFLPRGPGPGARSGSPGRMNPDYIPPPGEEAPEQSSAPPMTPVPDVPGEPRLDEVMPELANGFAEARPDDTRVATDQRIGDPSGLDVFRKKPQPVRPGLPVTGVPEDQPEAIPDMTPTDQDIEGLFNGEGMPERLQDDPSKDAVSAAFLRERGKAFGGAQGPIEGAPELYQEPGGIPWSETPEGQEFAAGDVMPPELVKPADMSDEEWAMLSDAEKRRLMQSDNNTFAGTFGVGTQ